ncbi:MAG: DUF5701 family protein [Actinomycetota bacterium]
MSEFDRQVENLLRKGCPRLARLEPRQMAQLLEPLRARANAAEAHGGCVPFVIVLKPDLLPVDRLMPLVERKRQTGFSVMPPEDLQRFKPIEGIRLPDSSAYLLTDVDTGVDLLNVTPDEALQRINSEQRSPLTLEEGVALLTHFPEALQKNRCFSLLGSRCGDRRVTALWISQGRPKLGWCWAGNPHTWLGSASCGERVGA